MNTNNINKQAMHDMVDMFKDRCMEDLQPEEYIKAKYDAGIQLDMDEQREEITRLNEIDYLLDVREALNLMIEDGTMTDEDMLKYVIGEIEGIEVPLSEMLWGNNTYDWIEWIIEMYQKELDV